VSTCSTLDQHLRPQRLQAPQGRSLPSLAPLQRPGQSLELKPSQGHPAGHDLGGPALGGEEEFDWDALQ
jgi:hypothetical protein